ncbi:Pyridoxine/pyridoxamine 5'-phosphate oxidase 2 [Raphanus sativus]|nr:Pyridoxine/pyridoxamine 5'-phosphate oxidase 2 [Raphanus sativus]
MICATLCRIIIYLPAHISTGFYSLGLQALGWTPFKSHVVFRGFEEKGDMIKPTPIFVVIQELEQFPFSQDTWEHVRINGKVEVIDASNSDQTKLQLLRRRLRLLIL